MAFIPWSQQVSGARFGEPPEAKPPEKEYGWPWEKRWWEEPWRGLYETTPEGTRGAANIPTWIRDIGIGLTGGTALSGLTGGAALAGVGAALGKIPVVGGLLGFPASHSLLTGLGLTGLGAMQGGEAPTTPAPETAIPVTPVAPTTTPVAPTLPQPGEGIGETTGPLGQPQTVEVGGQQFWWNPTGGIYGTGGWDLIPTRTAGLTPEQQIAQAEADRLAALERAKVSAGTTAEQRAAEMATREAERAFQAAQAEAARQAQMEQIRLQYQLEQRAMMAQLEQQQQMQEAQAMQQRQAQEAMAAQQMAQMYAADPYKYWAQLGQGTPEAVARLTGGQIGAGEQMGQVPLSVPSAQWWGNLLPSEQQQIGGGLNWLGVNPEDWYSMYQRMIPGLGSRQIEPMWAR